MIFTYADPGSVAAVTVSVVVASVIGAGLALCVVVAIVKLRGTRKQAQGVVGSHMCCHVTYMRVVCAVRVMRKFVRKSTCCETLYIHTCSLRTSPYFHCNFTTLVGTQKGTGYEPKTEICT